MDIPGVMSVSASDVRIPSDARKAVVERHEAVVVATRNEPSYVLIDSAGFDLVRGILERRRRGFPTPVENLLTDDDFDVLNEERESDANLARGVLSSWE